MPLVTLPEIRAAHARIAGVAVRTGLYPFAVPGLPFALHIKAESEQPIGSFKLRGAYNMAAQLPPEQLKRGLITYSSGNHAQGVAFAARALGTRAVIVMPSNAPEIKRAATAALGAEIVTVGPASSERRVRAEALAAVHGYTIIPPYDHPHIIAGQGTCALEVLEDLPETDLILSPVSGGGLLSGIATATRLVSPQTPVWGAEPALAADAKQSFDTRTLVEWPAALTTRTLSDGLRTQSLGALNFEHILRYADGIVTVTEDEVLQAMRLLLTHTRLVPEPSGAVTVAAALFHHEQLPPAQTVVAVLSGGNLEPALHRKLQTDVAGGSPGR